MGRCRSLGAVEKAPSVASCSECWLFGPAASCRAAPRRGSFDCLAIELPPRSPRGLVMMDEPRGGLSRSATRMPMIHSQILTLVSATVVVAAAAAAQRRQLPASVGRDSGVVRVVLLGTGTPIPDPERGGPSTAVVVNGASYLVDAGPGVVRRATAAAARDSLAALRVANLRYLFLPHLHSDHTLGLPDLM